MGNVIFNIELGSYRLKTEIIYRPNNTINYKVHLRDKFFILEESLLNKSDKWKLREMSNNIDLDRLLENLPEIIKGIEKYMRPKTQKKRPWD